MSYCRFSEKSEIHAYPTVSGHGTISGGDCAGCILDKPNHYATLELLRDHIQDHINAGHKVPDRVIPEIEADIEAAKAKV